MYKRNVGTKGVEARLYGALFAGPGLAAGCIIFGLTAIQSVHWIAPCVGLVIILSTSYSNLEEYVLMDSVGLYDISSLFRISVGMLWVPCLICCGSYVVSPYFTGIVFPTIHQPGKSASSSFGKQAYSRCSIP
jgi:hypothetical protein